MNSKRLPTSLTGLSYVESYPGGLNLLEEVLDITIIICVALTEPSLKSYFLCGAASLAVIQTAVFLVLHIKGVFRSSKLSWHWIEFVSIFITAILLGFFSSVVLTVFTKGYIITAILGYLTSMVYLFDTYHKYQVAVTPAPKYAWTTPNMPELN